MNLSRRSFLRRSALVAGSISAAHLLPIPNILSAPAPGRKLNCVLVGCGGRGMNHLDWIVGQARENLLAAVDPDEKRHEAVRGVLNKKEYDGSKVRFFTDYRKMFDQLGKQIDAVFVASPNHHHAGPSIFAMQQNIAVFCEKPLCHDVAEARHLRQLASQSKAATQMGNQGHCEDGYRRLCEFVAAGIVGNITQTHSWTDRANGGSGPRPPAKPAPAGLQWEEWIGPAPFRKFHDDLHPHEWHGWYDFGNGSLGNMGCHVLDGVYWALNLDHPTAIELEEIRGGSDERYPTGSRIRYDFPARGDMPALKAYWYEGFRSDVSETTRGNSRSARGKLQNLPPLIGELMKQYPDEEFDSNGTLYVGEKGILYTGTYGGRMRLVPMEKMVEIKQPPRTLPRPKNVMMDFLEACRNGSKATAASFDYASRLTEFVLLGNLAQHAKVGQKIEWDGLAMRVTNVPELNRWVKFPARPGWPT